MKLTLSLLLSAATITSTSLASPALGSGLPDSRFRVELTFHTPFLPVNPTFMNIVHFMKVVAQVEFEEQLQPRTYSAPTYRQVQITTYTWTEARFLLWGMYLAVTDMVKFYRFHNVMVKLYWDNIPVGQINLMVKPDLNLPGTTRNGTHYVIDDGQQLSLAGSSNKTKELFVKRLNTPAVQRVTGNDTVEAVKTGNTAFGIPTVSPVSSLPSALLSLRVTVDFYRVVGAKKLSRNDVFLTFFTAMLHLAKFPVENDMQFFNSKIPTIDLRVQMYETGLGCLVIPLASFVPCIMRVQ
ncbi:MAG: hypothetical protein Q9161_003916 [Pseudevernia consocians]